MVGRGRKALRRQRKLREGKGVERRREGRIKEERGKQEEVW